MSERRAWSILTKTSGGTVSVVRDLTLDECRKTYERLNPWYGHTTVSYESEGGGNFTGSCRLGRDSDVEVREVFGPEDWDRGEVSDWDSWPKRAFIELDDPRHPKNQQPVHLKAS